MYQDGILGDFRLDRLEGSLFFFPPSPFGIFAGQSCKGFCERAEIPYESSIEVGKSEEGLGLFYCIGRFLPGDRLDFVFLHGDSFG